MTELSHKIQFKIAHAFPTLIGRFEISDTDATNKALLEELLRRASNVSSSDYANAGGWHSAGDLLDWPNPEIAEVRSWIAEGLSRMVHATSQLPEVVGRTYVPQGRFRVSAWANVSYRGHYHRLHNHPNSAWSGVYYVTGSVGNDGIGGVLELFDPRPFTEMVDTPCSPYGQRVLIRPMPGLMVLFPSWLYHFVHPSVSDSARVSIAFNAAWIAE